MQTALSSTRSSAASPVRRRVETGYTCRGAFRAFHQREQRFAVLVCHRRAGKTVATINDLVDAALRCTLSAPRYAYIAPLHSQAKDIAWDYLKRYTAAIPGSEVHEGELRVDLLGDRRIRLYGADNPDKLRGLYLDGVVLDEPAQMKKAMWEEVLRPALADRKGFAIFIGTPKGRDWFYETYRRAEKSEEWFTLLLKASESQILSPEEITAMTADMPPAIIAQEMECSFEAPNVVQFISGEIVDAARDRTMQRSYGARIMGVDVTRFGDDRTVILVRTDQLEYVRVLKGIDTMQTAALVAEEAKVFQPQAIFVDGAGVGGGVVDRLRMLRFVVFDVQSGAKANAEDRYSNKRAEMWGEMKGWLKERGSIPNSVHAEELVNDLLSPQYSYDNAGRVVLEKKSEMKARGMRSPDIGDALALTFAEPVASPEMRAVWQTEMPAKEFDPLSDY